MELYRHLHELLYQNLEREALSLIDSLPETLRSQQIIKTNFYCTIACFNGQDLSKIEKVLLDLLTQAQSAEKTAGESSRKISPITLLFTRFNMVKLYQRDWKRQGKQGKEGKESKEGKQDRLLSHLQKILGELVQEHLGEYVVLLKKVVLSESQKMLMKDYFQILREVYILLQTVYSYQKDSQKTQLYGKAQTKLEINFAKKFQSNHIIIKQPLDQ